MIPPLTRRELRAVMLKRIRKQQSEAVAAAAVVLSQADGYLCDRRPAVLAHLESRYLALHSRMGADNNALQVLTIEFITDVSEAYEKEQTLAWVYEDRAVNRAANRRAFEIDSDQEPR